MVKHGIFTTERGTNISAPVTADSGIPFFLGVAPVQAATKPAQVGIPVLCKSWDEYAAAFGYSEDWDTYTLCECAYSHFRLFGMQPAIFCNVLDSDTMTEVVAASDKAVANHKVMLPITAKAATVVVKAAGGAGDAFVPGTDYTTTYVSDGLCVELIASGAAFSAQNVSVAYTAVKPASVTADTIVDAIDAADICATKCDMVPDLLCAPGFSKETEVAFALAGKAASINGMFRAKALVDIDTADAEEYSDAVTAKPTTDGNVILCWPMVGLGDKKFHLSTQLAGLMASVDAGNDGCPVESPSNKQLRCDSLILEDGTDVILTVAQANALNNAGIVTALHFMGGMVAWGNYTACYPVSTDVKDYFIPVSRMFDWVTNSVIRTFWSKLDKPMTNRLIDCIMDTLNIWLNGLVGSGYLLGARAVYDEASNTPANLMAGKLMVHLFITPPSPAQEIDAVLEYDADVLVSAFAN